jgi:two-component system NtrC family sensor kinase
MIVVQGVYTYFTIQVQTSHLMDAELASANRTSDVIKRSTRYGMLYNRREDVHQIIKTIGSEPGVDGIRIYNKKGEIMFSTTSGEEQTAVDMNAEACYMCHAQQQPIESVPFENRTRIYSSAKGNRVLGVINPIKNEPDCYNSDCHAHPSSKTILGVLDVKMSLEQVDKFLAESKEQMIVSSVLMTLLIAVISGVFIWIVVHIPVRKLIAGTRALSNGNLDYTINVKSGDEIGRLAESFNTMTYDLKKARDEITEWSNTLEHKVRERTDELKKVETQIIQIEKMASLGKLAATVAHELNNPLEGILTYTKLLVKQLKNNRTSPEDVISMVQDLSFVADETIRCGNIVKNLLLFSKKQVSDFSTEQLKTIIEKSLTVVKHHLEMHNVKLEKELQDDSELILCDSNQLQQAFIALFVNAVEAMPEGGTLKVESKYISEKDAFQMKVDDTGVGIPEDAIQNIFEPFFTTKMDGKGVGLGLSVVYGIVERHGGHIEVRSKVNQGTTFIISLPRNHAHGRQTKIHHNQQLVID